MHKNKSSETKLKRLGLKTWKNQPALVIIGYWFGFPAKLWPLRKKTQEENTANEDTVGHKKNTKTSAMLPLKTDCMEMNVIVQPSYLPNANKILCAVKWQEIIKDTESTPLGNSED